MIIGKVIFAPRVRRVTKIFTVNKSLFPSKTTTEPVTITYFTLDVSVLDGSNMLA